MSIEIDLNRRASHAEILGSFEDRLRESDMFHAGAGRVYKTLETIAATLDGIGVDYALIGGMALNAHGYARETTDVDVLVTPEGLERFQRECVGKGYRPAFGGARKTFRDAETNIKVEFVTSGEFPGDGKPKPVAFPDPATVSVMLGTKKVISLPGLVTLKLASGMTNQARLRDLADVQDLIRTLNLDEAFARQIHPYVRDRYLELLAAVREGSRPEE